MYILIFFIIFFLGLYQYCYSSVWFVFRFVFCVLGHLKDVICDGFTDICLYIEGKGRFKDYGYYIYGGSFGNGKTLNMVKHAKRLIKYYGRYYRVTVISNMYLKGIDYLPFQFFEDLEYKPDPDEICIYLIDEGGSIFYSRNYSKSRLNEEDLVLALNQVRKDNKCILMSCQRHKMLDAALRRVCTVWFEVEKHWRFSFIAAYDGYDLEYIDPASVKPIGYRVEYATNADRKAYRNKERIVNLSKERLSFDEGSSVNISLHDRGKAKRRKKAI